MYQNNIREHVNFFFLTCMSPERNLLEITLEKLSKMFTKVYAHVSVRAVNSKLKGALYCDCRNEISVGCTLGLETEAQGCKGASDAPLILESARRGPPSQRPLACCKMSALESGSKTNAQQGSGAAGAWKSSS